MNRDLLQLHIRYASEIRPLGLEAHAIKGITLGTVIGGVMWGIFTIVILFAAGVLS